MKRLLLPLLAAFALPIAVNAEISDKIHNRCKDAKDYIGCVKAQSGALDFTKVIKGNACPIGHAYLGNGLCGHVFCNLSGLTITSRHDARLGGKGWTCKRGGGTLKFASTPPIPLTLNKQCPKEEPEIGRYNSCQNG